MVASVRQGRRVVVVIETRVMDGSKHIFGVYSDLLTAQRDYGDEDELYTVAYQGNADLRAGDAVTTSDELWAEVQAAAPGPLLECGHYGSARERLRTGNEKWCDECCCWREAVS